MAISFELNGRRTEVDVDPDMPLLWVLRDVQKLTGTKFGCGRGLCGACTVHVDGEPMRSCQYPIAGVAAKKVTTIEALGESERHPLQQAWIDLQVPQCGYCQSGQLMTASALLRKHPKPTREQIKTEMSGNLCRCGSYPRIERAILLASGQSDPGTDSGDGK